MSLFNSNPLTKEGWLIAPTAAASEKKEEPEDPKPSSAKPKADKKSSGAKKQETKPKSTAETQSPKAKPFPTLGNQDELFDPKTGFFLNPKKQQEPTKAPEKPKGLMVQPQQPQKTIMGMKYDPPKPAQPKAAEPPEEVGERHWFLEGLLGDDYTTKFNKQPTPDDPFLQGLYGVEEPKHHTEEPNTPQQFVSKTQPIDKFMGVTPSAPFDRPLDNPQYSQPPLPPKPEGGEPKDYVHNPDGKKTYDFRNPQLSALDYVFGKDFKPIEWKQGIDSGGKLGYDGNKTSNLPEAIYNSKRNTYLTPLEHLNYGNVDIIFAKTPGNEYGYLVGDNFFVKDRFEKGMADPYTRTALLYGPEAAGKLVAAEVFANQETFRNFAADMQNFISQEARAYASMDRVGEVIGSGKQGAGKEDGFGAKAIAEIKINPKDIKPPGWNDNWNWRYPEANKPNSKPRWFDPNGGEWRWHAPDKWHPEGHWDHNPWDAWNSGWQNIYPDN